MALTRVMRGRHQALHAEHRQRLNEAADDLAIALCYSELTPKHRCYIRRFGRCIAGPQPAHAFMGQAAAGRRRSPLPRL